jgi:hypothetical protein
MNDKEKFFRPERFSKPTNEEVVGRLFTRIVDLIKGTATDFKIKEQGVPGMGRVNLN